jgi:hypothetical protein
VVTSALRHYLASPLIDAKNHQCTRHGLPSFLAIAGGAVELKAIGDGSRAIVVGGATVGGGVGLTRSPDV